MRRVAIVVTTAFVALASCFIKPDRPEGTAGDGGVDGATKKDDGGLPDGGSGSASCVVEGFDGLVSDSCGSWGTISTNTGTVTQGNSQLRLNLAAGSAAYVRCVSAPRQVTRLTIDLNQVIATSTGGESTFVGVVENGGSRRWGLEFVWDMTNTRIAWNGLCPVGGASVMQAWSASTQRVLLIERTSVGISLKLGDGTASSFSQIGSCANDPAFDAIVVELGAQRGATPGTAATATFERLEICP